MLKRFLLIAVLLGLFSPSSFSYEADVEYLSTKEYFDVVLTEIDTAEESISVYMYLASISEIQQKSRPYRLVNALVRAHKRGVKVECILDQNLNFVSGTPNQQKLRTGRNITSYDYLKKHGVPVYFDSPSNYLHSKILIIDNETIILGSSNWSRTRVSPRSPRRLIPSQKTRIPSSPYPKLLSIMGLFK